MARILRPTINPLEVATTEVKHSWIDKMLNFKSDDTLPIERAVARRVKWKEHGIRRVEAHLRAFTYKKTVARLYDYRVHPQ
ncbi:hypothetical protein BHM03_00018677 [Ensete ventricosum]|nr:hypothetical protein BHM03_00018677 [Ensete ventricosum]